MFISRSTDPNPDLSDPNPDQYMFISRSTDLNPDLSDPNPDLHDQILLDPNTCLLVRVRTRIRIY